MFGAMLMALAAAIRYGVNKDGHVFHLPHATIGALAYAVLVSSALCYGLISWTNKHVSSLFVTSFWPVQVIVTVILSYLVFSEKLVSLEYVGAVFIALGMFAVCMGERGRKKGDDGVMYDPLTLNAD